MGLLINKTDFIGKYQVGRTNFDSLDAYISRYEEVFLIELLGFELFKLFKAAYLASIAPIPVPMPTIYQVIYDAIREDITTQSSWCPEFFDEFGNCQNIRQNFGMKSMVLGMVWFEYVREFAIKMTSSGASIDAAEVSTFADSTFMYQRYNESINDQYVIQWYIKEHIVDYPLFNVIRKPLAHWSL